MATYGRGQMLGSGINPESFKQDYSGFARAAEMQAQGISNLGASIGGVIKDFGEAREQRKKVDADTKASRAGIESAIKLGDALGFDALGFDVKGMLSPVLERMDDPNTTPMEAAALGREASSQIANVLNLGFKVQDQSLEKARLSQDAAYKNEQLKISMQNANSRAKAAIAAGGAAPSTEDMPLGDGSTQKMQWNKETQSYVPIKVSGFGDSQAQKGTGLTNLVKGFEGFNPNAYNDYKQTSIGYGTKGDPGETITEEEASNRLQTELAGHAERIKKAAKIKGISLNENQFNALTSFDYNTGKGANLIERFGENPNQLASKILEYTKAGGEDLPGLVRRRGIEAALFLASEQQPTTQNQERIGFTPAEAAQEPVTITIEKLRELMAVGVRPKGTLNPDGTFSVTDFNTGELPQGMTIESDGQGGIKVIQGPGVGTKAEKTERAAEFQEKRQTNFIIDKANEAEEIIDNSISTYGAGTLIDMAKSTVPGTQEYKLKIQILPALKDSIALDALKQLKAASPTGSTGLGSVTEKEGKRLENMYGVLEVGGDKVTLKNDIKRLKETAFDYIHGSKNEREKALAEGKITKDQNDQVEQMYREQILGVSGTKAPVSSGVELLPDEQNLIDKYKTE